MTIKHSKIGASSAKRWMNCPGSVRLCDGVEQRSSKYAAEGQAAHKLAETCLRMNEDAVTFVDRTVEGYVVSYGMAGAVQFYLDTIRADMEDEDELDIEVGISLDAIHTGMFGTADAIRYRPSTQVLSVYDYKHGAGVAVDVFGNPQLAYYGAGAAYAKSNRGIAEVELVIVQPRCPHRDGPVRRATMSVIDMLDFLDELKQAAIRTEDPHAPLNRGEWCQFCPAAGICPALHKMAVSNSQKIFDVAVPYDMNELAEVLADVPRISKWLKSVNSFAYQEMCAGKKIPGFKLVAKRGTRRWRSDSDTVAFLSHYGMDQEIMFEAPKLKSVAQIEKVIGEKNKHEIAELVVTETSGYTIAPVSDRRPEASVTEATAYFTAVQDEENEEKE